MPRLVAATASAACLLALVAGVAFVPAGAPAPPAGSRVVSIFAPRCVGNDCSRVLPLRRRVAAPALLRGAMRALLAGPTRAERTRGYGGWFSVGTAGRLRSVRIAHNVAFVDFHDFSRVIPNASTSCGSALLLAQLDRTAKQFPDVHRTVYSFDGSRRAFYEWLQLEAPQTR